MLMKTKTLLLSVLMTLSVGSAWAQSVSTITTSENAKTFSNVYIGEVVVDGESKIKYIYSSNLSRTADVLANLLSALQGMSDGDYATLLGGVTVDEEATGVAICSDPTLVSSMDESWSSAKNVGTQNFSGATVASESTSDAYDTDAGYKAKVDALAAARTEGIDRPLDGGKNILTHIDSRTITDVYYTIEDGKVVRHSDTNVVYDTEVTEVLYTKAELSDVTVVNEVKASRNNVPAAPVKSFKDGKFVIEDGINQFDAAGAMMR